MSPVPAAHTTPIKHCLNGAINGFTYGNGIVHTSHQNTRQLPDLNKALGVTNDAYTYGANANANANANLATITDSQRNLNSRTTGYDDLGRLTSVSAPQSWGTATDEYDGIDNLTKSTITGGGSGNRSGTDPSIGDRPTSIGDRSMFRGNRIGSAFESGRCCRRQRRGDIA